MSTNRDERPDDHVELEPEEARSAEKTGRMRNVLLVSIFGAVLAFLLVWAFVV